MNKTQDTAFDMATEEISKNLAAVVVDKCDVRLKNIQIPEPDKHEVQVFVKKVGICGTDVHIWEEGAFSDIFKLPMILGHECSGVVSKIGEGVSQLKVGDRVFVGPLRPCRSCEFCSKGRTNVCPKVPFFFAAPPFNGAMAKYLIQEQNYVFKLPDHVSFEEGALIEPLSVSIRTCNRARITAGDTVVISGAGTIGLCALLVAKAYGASSIIITDVIGSRLELAKQLGATHTLQVQSGETPEDVTQKINEILGCYPDKALECCGNEFSVSVCILAVKPCGVVGLVGIGDQYMNIALQRVIIKEIDVMGSFAIADEIPTAIDMVASRRINVLPLITHRYHLHEIVQALETTRSRTGLKTVVECNPN